MKGKIDFRYNLKVYFDLLRKYRFMFLFLLLVVLLLEGISLTDKFLFKIIVDNGTSFAQGSLLREGFIAILMQIALIFGAVVLVRAGLKYLLIHLINRLEAGLIQDLKKKFFNHILNLSYHFHTTHRTGSLISRLVRGGRSIENMTDILIFNVAPLIFQLSIVSLSLLYFDWIPAVVILGTISIFIAYSYVVQRKQQPYTVAANDTEDYEKANISDFFMNIDSIKHFGKEKAIAEKFHSVSTKTGTSFIRHWDFYRQLDAGQTLIIGLGTFFVAYFPLIQFLNKEITLGTLVFIYTAYGNLLVPMYSFVRGMRDFYRVMADFESLFQYGKISNEIKDLPRSQNFPIRKGEIEFQKVVFGYPRRKLFDDFNLHLKPNTKVALVGYSGSGKTTLVRLLYRLYDLQSGRILIDGRDIREWRQEFLRSELSLVPQECLLFDDTIYNNVAFSNPRAGRKEVLQAMKFAQLDQVVRLFPRKENTIVGERGVRLSGGEKQRVSIARAILADKKILILDEATSSLDSKTEHEIKKDLQELMKGRTTIIIAHRLSTVMSADLIVVLDKWKIVQMGTHAELIKNKGLYQQLWELQKGGYIK